MRLKQFSHLLSFFIKTNYHVIIIIIIIIIIILIAAFKKLFHTILKNKIHKTCLIFVYHYPG